MDKNVLRSVLRDLTPGETINVHFRGTQGPQAYQVVSTKRGRGKHGSLLATITCEQLGEREIGTPRNEEIISVLSRGNFYGVNTEREDPVTYPTDEAQATRMKARFIRLTGEAGRGSRVQLESTVPEYNGTFTVTNGRLEKGKYGQVHLWLTSERSGETVELWSYRHSGIITSFEVL
jgi:hypothetical protein